MLQKLPVGDFKWIEKDNLSKFDEEFIKHYDVDSDIEYLLEVDVHFPKNLHRLHSDLPYLPEINKCSKLINTLHDKKKLCYPHKSFKGSTRSWLKLTKVLKVIGFKQIAWLKPYINMNTKLRTNATNNFFKDFFKLMNNAVFGKTMENVRNHRDIKIATTNKQRKKFAPEPNCYRTKYISEDNGNEKDRSKNE